MELKFRYFRGTLATWDQLFDDAAEFATALGFEKVVSLSHSADGANGVVVVWFWHADGDPVPPAEP